MISGKDIESFFLPYQKDEYYKTFKELSQSNPDDPSTFLVESQEKAYNLDDVKKTLIRKGNLRSADAMYIRHRGNRSTIYLIEFKKGFLRKIKRTNFDPQLWECTEHGVSGSCETGAEYFKKYMEKTKNELMLSLYMKLSESFLLLQTAISPRCMDAEKEYDVKYLAVVDGVNEDPLGTMEDGLNGLAGKTDDNNNLTSLKKGIKHYILTDDTGQKILYDYADVLLKEEFESMLPGFA